jgi:Leucine-rich repeat (LRR) protein
MAQQFGRGHQSAARSEIHSQDLGDDAFANVFCVHSDAPDQITDADLEKLSTLPRVKLLSVTGPEITDRGIKHISKMEDLQRLQLTDTKVTSVGISHLSSNESLGLLILQGSRLDDKTLRTIDAIPNLESLQFIRADVSPAAIACIGKAKHLRRLDFLLCPNLDDKGIQHLSGLPNLTELSLNSTKVTDDALIHIGSFHKLKWLDLNDTPITGSGLQHLSKLKNLKSLDISGTQFEDDGAKSTRDLNSVDYLKASKTKITDAALVHIGQMNSLRWLNISGTDVSDFDSLARNQTSKDRSGNTIELFKNLETLRLTDSTITDNGLRELVKQFPNLTWLDISGTKISDTGIAHIKSLKKLQHLQIGPNVTLKAVQELLRYNANLVIDSFDPSGKNSFFLPN